MTGLLGRNSLLATLAALAEAGHTVLIHGPWGIGKSALLGELHRRVRACGRPCGLAPNTRSLGDVTSALAGAYPGVPSEGRNQRQLRSALRMAVESNPGVLLLDHLAGGGTALKGFLRSLQGTGLGVVLAADVEDQRDRDAARSLGLAYREVEVPPLAPRHLRSLLASLLATANLPHRLTEIDRKTVLELAAGRPGWVEGIARRLGAPRYWRTDAVLVEILRCDLSLEVMAHHLRPG